MLLIQLIYLFLQWLNMLLNQEVKGKKFFLIYNNVTEHEEIVKDVTDKVDFDGLVLDAKFFK